MLLRPLPVARPAELVLIEDHHLGPHGNFGSFLQFQDLSAALPDVPLAASTHRTLPLAELNQRPLRTGAFVTPGFFSLLGLRAQLGELRLEGDEPVVVLSHALWREAFQGDPGILGRSLRIQDQHCRVVGIAPREFTGLEVGTAEELWLPLGSYPRFETDPKLKGALGERGFSLLTVQGRLSPARAATFPADLAAVARRLGQEHPESDGQAQWRVQPLDAARRRVLNELLPDRGLAFGASFLGLLLTAVGAASLMAARAARRQPELLLRGALGGDRWQLARPLLAEALVLAALALPLAVGTGWLLGEGLLALPGNTQLEAAPLHIDLGGAVLPAAAGLTLLVLGVSVLLPLRHSLRLDLASALRQGSRQAGSAGRSGPFVILQVALALSLLAASSVALGALRKGAQVGYPLAHRAFLQLNPKLATEAVDPTLPQRLLARARALPGVESAALGAATPLDSLEILIRLPDGQGGMRPLALAFVGPG